MGWVKEEKRKVIRAGRRGIGDGFRLTSKQEIEKSL